MSGTVTSRRAFLLRAAAAAAVAAPAIWIPRRASAQLNSPSFVAGLRRSAAGPSLACQVDEQATENNDYYPTSTNIAQRIRALSGEVCEVRLLLLWLSGTDARVKVQLWSNADRTGTQYGSDSSEVLVTSAGFYPTAAWGTFTFATAPAPPGAFWVCLVKAGADDVGWRIHYNHTPGSGYYPYTNATDDEAYCAYAYGANRTTTDCATDVRTMQ